MSLPKSVSGIVAALAASSVICLIVISSPVWSKDKIDDPTATSPAGGKPKSVEESRQSASCSTITTTTAPLDLRLLPPSAFEDWEPAPRTR